MKQNVSRIIWKRCEPGWWDAMSGNTYAGWSVARQCRVRRINRRRKQCERGWYVFNDTISKMIGPFKTPETAMRACPLTTG